jgi:DNA polymerase III subunit epsilon
MTTLRHCAGFDLETTGIDVFEDRVVTASIVYVNDQGNVIQTYEWLLNPGIEIPDEAAAVHGITTEQAQRYGEQPRTALYEIAGILSYFLTNDVPIVAYNAAYDFSLLNYDLERNLGDDYSLTKFFPNQEIPPLIIDPLVLDKKLDRYRKGSRKLTTQAERLGVSLENAHTSADDALAAVLVAQAMWSKYPNLSAGPIQDLYEAQQTWYEEQQLGLQDYFRKQGKNETVNTQWPIQRRAA